MSCTQMVCDLPETKLPVLHPAAYYTLNYIPKAE